MTDTSLEQLVIYETTPADATSNVATYASLLYTPPIWRGPSHGLPFRGIRFEPLPRLDLSPTAPRLLPFVTEILARYDSGSQTLDKTIYAKNAKEWGPGTIENVHVDYKNEETIKIYSDPVNNNLGVGHEPFGTKHPDKDYLRLSALFPLKDIKIDRSK